MLKTNLIFAGLWRILGVSFEKLIKGDSLHNSFLGTNWGENGYARIIRGKGLCKIGTDYSVLVPGYQVVP